MDDDKYFDVMLIIQEWLCESGDYDETLWPDIEDFILDIGRDLDKTCEEINEIENDKLYKNSEPPQ